MAIIVAAILIGIGAPALKATIDRRAVAAEADRLVRSINYARSEAINKQLIVGLERLSGTVNIWTDGWRVYSTPSNNITVAYNTGTDTLLRDVSAVASGATVIAKTAAANRIKFNQSGRLIGGAVAIVVCDAAKSTNFEGQRISINVVGRTSVGKIAPADKASDC